MSEQNIVVKGSRGELWFHNKWRPAMAWLWLCVIAFDVIINPYAFVAVQVIMGNASPAPWVPLTLSSSGFMIHGILGGIVGVNAWNRTREKLEGGLREIIEGAEE